MNKPTPLYRSPAFWTLAVVATCFVASPALAAGTADIQSFVDNIKSWLTGTIAKSVSVIAVAVCGYRFFTGRASAGPLIAVLAGIMLIFGASWVLDQVTGGS